MTRRRGIEAELALAGFSARTIYALKYGLQLDTLEQLRQADWGSEKERTGLAYALRTCPGLGIKGFAEVVAFREHGDAQKAALMVPSSVCVRLEPHERALLDVWASERDLTRTSAVRKILLDALGRRE